MARKANSKLLNYGIFIVSYVGLMGVVWFYRISPFIRWYNMTIGRDGFVQTWRVVGFAFEIVLAIVLITMVLYIGSKRKGD